MEAHGGFQPGYLYIMPDAGKKKSPIRVCFDKFVAKHMQVYDIHMDEESIRQRKRSCRSFQLIEQTEKLYVFCHSPASIPDRQRTYYKGSNRGQSWGFVVLDTYDKVWQVRWGPEEGGLWRSHPQVRRAGRGGGRAGGRRHGETKPDSGETKPLKEIELALNAKPDTMIPFCWHGFPKIFFKELITVNNAGAVIDFTPGDGNFAMAVLERGGSTLYCGFCHTEKHCVMLREQAGGLGPEGHGG